MKFLLSTILLLSSLALSQSTIGGTLYASDVEGFVIIGCLLDFTTQDCDYDKSPYLTIEQNGSSAAFELEAPAGDYLLIAWKDTNGNGQLDDDGSDEIGFYLDANNEPALVTAPMSSLEIHTTGNPQTANNPLNSTPASNPLASLPTNPAQNTSPLGDLVGIWQITRASGGDYKNLNTGYTFNMVSGYSSLLKIRANGDYEMTLASSSVTSSCLTEGFLEQSAGKVTYQGNQLILQPAWHTLALNSCVSPDKRDLGTDPIVYTFNLREEFDINGMRGAKLELTGGPIPLDMDLFHPEPLMPGYQPQQPADFVLGTDPPYQEFVGLWAPSPDSDVNFYNPQTGEFYFPEWNGSYHNYLRFNNDGSYEMAVSADDYNYYEGICNRDYIYYEKGIPSFSITESPQNPGDYTRGHAQFKATDARLIVNIRDCDEDDGVIRYNLVPQISYYTWELLPAKDDVISHPDMFYMQCPWERSEWQFMFCGSEGLSSTSYGRR